MCSQIRDRNLVALAALVIAMVAAPPVARAQDAPSGGVTGLTVSETLFMAGKEYMREKEYEKACAKFKASHDIDKTATGTLLNLALCHEQINKPASAWAEFRQVTAESMGPREDRFRLAREHEAKLFPILSWVTV